MANITQNKVSVYMTDELKEIVKFESNKKSMSTSAFMIMLLNDYLYNNTPQQKQGFIYRELDKVITYPTKVNYNRFIDILQDAFVTRQIPEMEYNRLYSMANIIPVK